ncbi:hypothetical protein T484DRAFT_3648178 [Baffinella frigidus]|nr:hypothetical protein T484DRAFT_3648178 [Cryptophyta sp. CCMP2293]
MRLSAVIVALLGFALLCAAFTPSSARSSMEEIMEEAPPWLRFLLPTELPSAVEFTLGGLSVKQVAVTVGWRGGREQPLFKALDVLNACMLAALVPDSFEPVTKASWSEKRVGSHRKARASGNLSGWCASNVWSCTGQEVFVVPNKPDTAANRLLTPLGAVLAIAACGGDSEALAAPLVLLVGQVQPFMAYLGDRFFGGARILRVRQYGVCPQPPSPLIPLISKVNGFVVRFSHAYLQFRARCSKVDTSSLTYLVALDTNTHKLCNLSTPTPPLLVRTAAFARVFTPMKTRFASLFRVVELNAADPERPSELGSSYGTVTPRFRIYAWWCFLRVCVHIPFLLIRATL